MIDIHYEESDWVSVKLQFESKFGADMEMDGILFLIGVQELGQGNRPFEKHEKMNLMHVAVCKLLSQYGLYTYTHRDEDGWPHYQAADNLPGLSKKQQDGLLKKAIIEYSQKELF